MTTLLGTAFIVSACGRSGSTLPSSTATVAAPSDAAETTTATAAPSTSATTTTAAPSTTSRSAVVACPPVSGGSEDMGILANAVAVFDTATGAFAWEVQTGGFTSVATTGDVLVAGDETAVRAYNGGDGSLRWCREPGGAVSAASDTVAILTATGALLGVDANTGRDRWSQQVAAPQDPLLLFDDMSPLHGGDANIYLDTSVATGVGGLVAFEAATGATRWTWASSACAAGSEPTMCIGGPWTPVEGSLVYVADPNAGRLVALDPATGVEQWSFAVAAQAGPWGVSTGGDIVTFTSNALPAPDQADQSMNEQLFAIDARSGDRRWVIPVATGGLHQVVAGALVVTTSQSGVGSAPPPAGTVPSVSTRVDAVDAATGKQMWSHDLPGEAALSMTPIGNVLITPSFGPPSMDPGFIALDADTGTERWRNSHYSTFTPTASHSTSGYEEPQSLAGGARFVSVIHFGTVSD